MQVTAINKEVESVGVRVWIQDAYKIYKNAKVSFTLFAIISTIIGAIPLIGAFMLPLFTAKYAEIASKLEKEEEISFAEFFIGLFSRKSIMIIGVFHLIVYLIAMAIKFVLTKGQDPTTITGDVLALVFTLVAILIIFCFILAFWLSPIICLKNDDTKAFSALVLSLKAFIRYSGKIIKYGFLLMFIGGIAVGVLAGIAVALQHMGYTILAFIPGSLGIIFILVWMPVLHLSAYFIYKSLFLTYNE